MRYERLLDLSLIDPETGLSLLLIILLFGLSPKGLCLLVKELVQADTDFSLS